jgi:hypothetical protein
MAVVSNNNIIMINRGDTFTFDFTIDDGSTDDGRYILKDDDALYFGIMDPHQLFENAIVKRRFTKDDCDDAGNLIITIRPEDTIDLCPGVYYYAVKLHRHTDNEEEYIDEVITIINKTKFIIND